MESAPERRLEHHGSRAGRVRHIAGRAGGRDAIYQHEIGGDRPRLFASGDGLRDYVYLQRHGGRDDGRRAGGRPERGHAIFEDRYHDSGCQRECELHGHRQVLVLPGANQRLHHREHARGDGKPLKLACLVFQDSILAVVVVEIERTRLDLHAFTLKFSYMFGVAFSFLSQSRFGAAEERVEHF